jgi:signal transduction histidine kinase
MHGGTVWLESQPNIGTEVFIRLPRGSQQARSAA